MSEEIERRHTQLLEVSNIARDYGEPVHDSHRGNHGILP